VALYTLIATAKLSDVDPQAWLATLFACLLDHLAKSIADCFPGTGAQNAVLSPDPCRQNRDGRDWTPPPRTRRLISAH
jgi:hypothetical protein